MRGFKALHMGALPWSQLGRSQEKFQTPYLVWSYAYMGPHAKVVFSMKESEHGQSSRPNLHVVEQHHKNIALKDRTDDELMLLCKAGQMNAMDVLVSRYETKTLGFSCKYLGDRALAEEACQETFVRLWLLREKFEAQGYFKAFLAKLNLNVCRELSRSRTRKKKALEKYANKDQPACDPENAEERALRKEQEKAVERLLAGLPKKLKEALLFRYFCDLSYAEMSKALGCSEETLRSRVFFGIRGLRKKMREGLL